MIAWPTGVVRSGKCQRATDLCTEQRVVVATTRNIPQGRRARESRSTRELRHALQRNCASKLANFGSSSRFGEGGQGPPHAPFAATPFPASPTHPLRPQVLFQAAALRRLAAAVYSFKDDQGATAVPTKRPLVCSASSCDSADVHSSAGPAAVPRVWCAVQKLQPAAAGFIRHAALLQQQLLLAACRPPRGKLPGGWKAWRSAQPASQVHRHATARCKAAGRGSSARLQGELQRTVHQHGKEGGETPTLAAQRRNINMESSAVRLPASLCPCGA